TSSKAIHTSKAANFTLFLVFYTSCWPNSTSSETIYTSEPKNLTVFRFSAHNVGKASHRPKLPTHLEQRTAPYFVFLHLLPADSHITQSNPHVIMAGRAFFQSFSFNIPFIFHNDKRLTELIQLVFCRLFSHAFQEP